MLRLALPVVTAEIGWMAMGVVDTLMVGRVGAEALGAVSIGRALFMLVAVCGIGLLLGLDTLVSQAFGAGEPGTCRRAAVHGVYLAVLISLPLTLSVRLLGQSMPYAGVNEGVTELALPYIRAVSWSALPVFLYSALRRYLQAMNQVRAVMFVLISANAVNFCANWLLIYGNWGAPALGAEGAGWATFASTLFLALSLLLLAAAEARRHPRVLAAV